MGAAEEPPARRRADRERQRVAAPRQEDVDALESLQQQMAEVGLKTEETLVEYLGYNSIHGPLADPMHADDLNEVYLRIAVRCANKQEAAKLGRLFPPLALSGPPFIGGAGGMMEPRGLLGIWPTLAPRAIIEEYVRVSVEES